MVQKPVNPLWQFLQKPHATLKGITTPVAGIQRLYCGTDFLDDAHIFMAKYDTRLCGCSALVHMQVRAANAGRGNLDDYIIGMLNFRVWNILCGHAERSLVHDSLHGKSSLLYCCSLLAGGMNLSGFSLVLFGRIEQVALWLSNALYLTSMGIVGQIDLA